MVTSACYSIMAKQKFGRIVNVSSNAIYGFGAGGDCAYGASKGAIFAITRELGRWSECDGIKINCIMPSAASRMGDLSEGTKKVTRTYFPTEVRLFPCERFSDHCQPSSSHCHPCERVTKSANHQRLLNRESSHLLLLFAPKSVLRQVRYLRPVRIGLRARRLPHSQVRSRRQLRGFWPIGTKYWVLERSPISPPARLTR